MIGAKRVRQADDGGSRMIVAAQRQAAGLRESIGDGGRRVLLLVRVGEVYCLFGRDARAAAAIIALPMMRLRVSWWRRVRVAWIGWQDADRVIDELLAAGRAVSIAEEIDEPRWDGSCRRAITRNRVPGDTVRLRMPDGTLTDRCVPVMTRGLASNV